MTLNGLEIGCRIRIGQNFGTVLYIGQVQSYAGNWVGVEWDDATRGKHSGTVNDVEYFKTSKPNSGSMIRKEKIPMFEILYDAISNKYTDKKAFEIDPEIIKEVQKKFHASIFEIVGMDKVGNKQCNLSYLVEVSVSYSLVNTCGNLSVFENLNSLDISSTLIWNWRVVADITRQIPTLSEINLANNRLVTPSNDEIKLFASSFKNLRKLNLRNCNIKDWKTVVYLAKMWIFIELLSLEDNKIECITDECDGNNVFLHLQTLDIQNNNIRDKESFQALAKIQSLESIFLMKNSITNFELVDCEYDEKVDCFPNLKTIHLRDNPISDYCSLFNELDKLISFEHLSVDVSPDVGYDETVSRAVGLISNLKSFNKTKIWDNLRRDSECDIWKRYAIEWCSLNDSEEKRIAFLKHHRCYQKIIDRLGDPKHSIPATTKKSTLININLLNSTTGESKTKRVPKRINLQTLKNLIIKLHNIPNTENFKMYVLDKERNVHIDLDNCNKSLDFYSIDENDTVEFAAC